MTVQVEIRVPASSNAERLLVRPVMPDGQLAGAEVVIEPGKAETLYVYEGVRLELVALAPSIPVAQVKLELELDEQGPHLDLRRRTDAVPA